MSMFQILLQRLESRPGGRLLGVTLIFGLFCSGCSVPEKKPSTIPRRLYVADFDLIYEPTKQNEKMDLYVESGQWMADIIDSCDEMRLMASRYRIRMVVITSGEYESANRLEIMPTDIKLFEKFSIKAVKTFCHKKTQLFAHDSQSAIENLDVNGRIRNEEGNELGDVAARILLSASSESLILLDYSSASARTSITAFHNADNTWAKIHCVFEVANPAIEHSKLERTGTATQKNKSFVSVGKKFLHYDGIIRFLAEVNTNKTSNHQLEWIKKSSGVSSKSAIDIRGFGKTYVEFR